jgi:hypothetical protein
LEVNNGLSACSSQVNLSARWIEENCEIYQLFKDKYVSKSIIVAADFFCAKIFVTKK